MKRMLVVMLLALVLMGVRAQASFYNEKLAEFARMRTVDSTDVVMLGDEFTEYAGDWNVLLLWKHVRNRGIAGDNVDGVGRRLGQMLKGKPKAVFLMVGSRDILDGTSAQALLDRYAAIVKKIRQLSPSTKLYVQSILPINEGYKREGLEGKTEAVSAFNRSFRHYCECNKIVYINLFKSFVRRSTNELRRELTQDGYALSSFGYKLWAFEIKKYMVEG